MNRTAIHSSKQLHLAVAQSSLAMAAVITAIVPLCSLLTFGSFVLRARLRLGYWPQPNHPDPAQLGFGIHWALAQFSLGAGITFPIWFVLVAFLPFAQSRVHIFRLTALTSLSWLVWLPFAYLDPWQFITWCID